MSRGNLKKGTPKFPLYWELGFLGGVGKGKEKARNPTPQLQEFKHSLMEE